jgi:hypothetical protein
MNTGRDANVVDVVHRPDDRGLGWQPFEWVFPVPGHSLEADDGGRRGARSAARDTPGIAFT